MRPSLLRLLNAPSMTRVLGKLKTEAPVYWETLKTTNKATFQEKITALNNWYTKFLHLDEVKMYQDRVVALQERLLEAQEKRREVSRSLGELRKKSNLLQDEIHKVKRSENIEKFLTLMKEETEVLKLESEVSRMFQECDQTERELFTAFTNAVRDSHEKQRSQLEYTKYFGIILSIAGSFLAFCYSTFKKNDLKLYIEDLLRQRSSDGHVSDKDVIKTLQKETTRLEHILQNKTARLEYQINLLAQKELQDALRHYLYVVGAGVMFLFLFKLC